MFYPITYDEPLFRPPSEARSLIIQVTLGCSWNRCAFCEMYTSKKFRVRKQEEVFADIEAFAPYASQIRRVFLADGDPLVLSTSKLLPVLSKLKDTFPRLTRISTYASPGNLLKKSYSELKELNGAGLDLLYVGIESGDDQVLENISKGETYASIVEGLNRSKEAGIPSSVMIINGVGGKELSRQHALNSANILNETQPKYASLLVLSHYMGLDHFLKRYKGAFTQMKIEELLSEMYSFIESTNLHETIFRSDHASNFLVLKGVLGRDKQKFLDQLNKVLSDAKSIQLRNDPEMGF